LSPGGCAAPPTAGRIPAVAVILEAPTLLIITTRGVMPAVGHPPGNIMPTLTEAMMAEVAPADTTEFR